jgi:hypothetical protein
MKTTKLIAVISVIALIAIVSSVSFVSALEQNEASITTFMSDASKVPGQETSIRVVFTNHASKELSVYYVGIHLDWMDKDQLYGIDYSNSPKTVAPGKELIFDIINYTVPSGTSYGYHSFYIGVDGKDADGAAFSWTSSDARSITVGTASSSQPATTTTPTATDQPQTFDMNLLIFGALITAAIVIIVLTAAVMKKRGGGKAAKSQDNPSVPPAPEQTPQEPNQDFNI